MDKFLMYQYLDWHFVDATKNIFSAWKNFLWFGLNYFSISTLIKTFFTHWHKYYYPYGRNWDPGRWVEAFVFNSASRIIGAILRLFFIIIGIMFEIFIFISGILILLFWVFLPIILLYGLVVCFQLIF